MECHVTEGSLTIIKAGSPPVLQEKISSFMAEHGMNVVKISYAWGEKELVATILCRD